MEINIVSKSKEESDKAFVNRQIKDRINTYISKYFNVKRGIENNTYILYKKPIYSNNKIENFIKLIIYNIDFLIQDILNSNKYLIMMFTVNGNEIKIDAYNTNEVTTYSGKLELLFNDIDNIKLTIKKQYYDWEYS